MRFESAVDWWFYLIVAVVAIAMWVSFVPQLRAEQVSALFAAAVTLLAIGPPVWLLLSTHYTVNGDILSIRSGPFSWKVPVSQIESVRDTRALWSSPALSLKRIEINYSQGKRILVSPKDREGFLNAIGQAI